MAGNDFFVRIALENRPVGKEELAESEPISFDKKLFGPSDEVCDRIIEKSYDEMLYEFKTDLKKLREKYSPFMKDHTPPAGINRRTQELNEFGFRYETEDDKKDITDLLEGHGGWEKITLPDYRGPVGKWTGYYRTEFKYKDKADDKRVYLRFLGVDYTANIYLNNRYVGSHEGFFMPFEFDVTDHLIYDTGNTLLVEIKNDIPTIGLDGKNINGDKIYAATGLGWDDPQEGWHHCPPGAGIYNRVLLEERSGVFIESVFVRPDIDGSSVEIRTQVYNTYNKNIEIKLGVSIFPFNFDGESISDVYTEGLGPAGPGINYYRFTCKIKDQRIWDPDEPWLYKARMSLKYDGDTLYDTEDAVFGMRKFNMDIEGEEKGSLFLNNEPIILRGANDMGHMQQCVFRENYEQLIDDILIAKLANMNYYRFTQRPVQEEIYHYCDMLGMMNQTDLPLFGYLRRNLFCEALRQTGEMERHIRNHPSSIMVTYINEPISAGSQDLGHRHLYRDELEAFFEAADRVIKVENPDRVVKHAEGDYDPPTGTGLSDFHCYNMWYTNHALPIGRLYKGWLPEIKKGWKTGCGEYGTEGLDNYEVMKKFYPDGWLPDDTDDAWIPDRIVLSQSNSMHGDWYEEQHRILDWIRESQKHQAFATSVMTDAFRRRSDRMVSTAVHLLIDAWPAGWMKTLVGVDRIPKPSYFSFKRSLEPVRVNLRSDRWKVYAGDEAEIEAWILNDTPDTFTGCHTVVTVRGEDRDYSSYMTGCGVNAVSAAYAGTVKFTVPGVRGRKKIYTDASLIGPDGRIINSERFCTEAFERYDVKDATAVAYLGENASVLASDLDIDAFPYNSCDGRFDVLIVSDHEKYDENWKGIEEAVREGSNIIFIEPDQHEKGWSFAGRDVKYINITADEKEGVFFLARDEKDSVTREFDPEDFSYLYNAGTDMIDFIAVNRMEAADLKPILFTYAKPSFSDRVTGEKRRLPAAGSLEYGKGKAFFLSLCLSGRTGKNPVLDRFLKNMIWSEVKQ
jgi:hypothetical protein